MIMTKQIKIGKVTIGGGNAIAVQSMTNISVKDIDATWEQCKQLQLDGCDIVRVAITDEQCCKAIATLKSSIDMPLVADIHFDYKLAIASIENGADKIRINPGNMSTKDVVKVIHCAQAHYVPIRIGVNSGSVDKQHLQQAKGNKVNALVNSLMEYVQFFNEHNFDDIVLSVKSSDVLQTIQCNRLIAQKCNYPIHIGVTEAGPWQQGIVKNSIGIGSLLADGIGDTIRVSLTAHPVEEVKAGIAILRALNLKKGLTFVSCPQCGRCSIELEKVANTIYEKLQNVDKPLKIAVMGCEVNGPGECRDADLGLAGGKGKVAFFKHGEVYKIVDSSCAVEQFIEEVEKLI